MRDNNTSSRRRICVCSHDKFTDIVYSYNKLCESDRSRSVDASAVSIFEHLFGVHVITSQIKYKKEREDVIDIIDSTAGTIGAYLKLFNCEGQLMGPHHEPQNEQTHDLFIHLNGFAVSP